MEFTEMEEQMLYQTKGCERYAVINELSMASQYAGDPARRKAYSSYKQARADMKELSNVRANVEHLLYKKALLASMCGSEISKVSIMTIYGIQKAFHSKKVV